VVAGFDSQWDLQFFDKVYKASLASTEGNRSARELVDAAKHSFTGSAWDRWGRCISEALCDWSASGYPRGSA
jgi:hypothetical protein